MLFSTQVLGIPFPVNVSRRVAMRIPAIAKGRALLHAVIATRPLRAYKDGQPLAEQPTWLYRSDTGISPRMRTKLILGDYNSALRSTFDVTFKRDESLGTYVPVERNEQFDNPRRPEDNRIVGRATYANFRRYELKSGDTRQSRRP